MALEVALGEGWGATVPASQGLRMNVDLVLTIEMQCTNTSAVEVLACLNTCFQELLRPGRVLNISLLIMISA